MISFTMNCTLTEFACLMGYNQHKNKIKENSKKRKEEEGNIEPAEKTMETYTGIVCIELVKEF